MWIPPIVVVRKVGIVVELVAWRGLHLSIILILSKAHNLKPLFCLITYPIFKKIKHIIVSYFIFHYVTINSLLAGRTSYIRSSFTSHYVTINSAAFCAISRSLSSFTSHYVTMMDTSQLPGMVKRIMRYCVKQSVCEAPLRQSTT